MASSGASVPPHRYGADTEIPAIVVGIDFAYVLTGGTTRKERNKCAIECLTELAPDGVIVFDNTDRPRYREAYDFLAGPRIPSARIPRPRSDQLGFLVHKYLLQAEQLSWPVTELEAGKWAMGHADRPGLGRLNALRSSPCLAKAGPLAMLFWP